MELVLLAALPGWFWPLVFALIVGGLLWYAIGLATFIPEPGKSILRVLLIVALAVFLWVRFV